MTFHALLAVVALQGSSPAIEVWPDLPLTVQPPGELPAQPGNLQRALSGTDGPVRLVLRSGRYLLMPSPYVDPSCGNCEDPDTSVPATLGVRVSGRGIELVGTSEDSVIIQTGAGYGLLFDDCQDCVLSRVTITDGVRDPDGRATSAAVVVRRSRVRLDQCIIRDNIGDSATVANVVVGIAGIAVREGGDLTVEGCRIVRNSWDGIVLYRSARAEIRDNVVDGVDKARGSVVGGGRGVGIGLTWDARATVEGNLVTRYWKGIGAFVNAHAVIRENVVEDILTWGIAYWGAGTGRPVAVIRDNVVYRTGACGVMLSADSAAGPGELVGNLIVQTGQDERYDSGEPYCLQRPVASHAVPPDFTVEDNHLYDNRQPGDVPLQPELDRAAFVTAAQALSARLRGRSATSLSAFLSHLSRL